MSCGCNKGVAGVTKKRRSSARCTYAVTLERRISPLPSQPHMEHIVTKQRATLAGAQALAKRLVKTHKDSVIVYATCGAQTRYVGGCGKKYGCKWEKAR